MKFTDLGLAEPILRAIAAEGYTVPTPIQVKAIPHVLEGRDLLGCAQTGTGKTAAFALPIIHRLASTAGQDQVGGHNNGHDHVRGHSSRTHRSSHTKSAPRALILAATRELASQIAQSFAVYGCNAHLKHTVIFGGVSQHHQVKSLQRGVDILIATPGRLLDLMNQGYVDLRSIQILVLDEADRMLDMGFIHDIRTIVKSIPARRQTLLFSATMPCDIRALASSILHEPVSVQVNPPASTVHTVAQSVYFLPAKQKPALLAHLLKANGMSRTLVFTRTKRGADRVVKHLERAGIRADAIHSNKSQNARTRALQSFKSDKPPVLVATDIASRGIDVDAISHVINFDVPNVPESYVHRIGRTARAGASGVALTFCDPAEREDLRAIERVTRAPIAVERNLPELSLHVGAIEVESGGQHRIKRSRDHQPSGRSHRSGDAHPSERSHYSKRHHQHKKQRSGVGAGSENGSRSGQGFGNSGASRQVRRSPMQFRGRSRGQFGGQSRL